MPGAFIKTSLSVIVPVINNFRTRGYVVPTHPEAKLIGDYFFVDTINIALLIFALI